MNITANWLGKRRPSVKYIMYSLKSLMIILTIEIAVYYVLFRKTEVALYAFLWTGIFIGALLLKVTNAPPVDNPLNVTRAEQHANLVSIKKLFPSYNKNSVTSKPGAIIEILVYVLVIIINALLVYFYG
jgi:hypothetical protein